MYNRYMFRLIAVVLALVAPILLPSCIRPSDSLGDGAVQLGGRLFWALCDGAEDADEASSRAEFRRLDTSGSGNIERLVGREGRYIWIRADFTVPGALRGRDLGLVVAYLHFAGRAWLNGVPVGSMGSFPPDERSILWDPQCLRLPSSGLSPDGPNTLMIKVWAHGKSHISDDVFVCDYDDAVLVAGKMGFFSQRVFLVCEGWLICSSVLFMLMFIWRRKERSNLAFALLNGATIVFLTLFFLPEIPWYYDSPASFLTIVKTTLCCGFYFVCAFASLFIMKFLGVTIPRATLAAIGAVSGILSVFTLAMPDYNSLMHVCPYFLITSFSQFVPAFVELFRALRSRSRRRIALVMLVGFSPFLACAVVDVAVRLVAQDTSKPYFSAFGWQASVFVFLVLMSIRYNRVYARYEYLSSNLRREVVEKTRSLSEANERLESEIQKSNIDLEMASIVQEKFLPAHEVAFLGWDVAVCYKAAAKVSGDLYDYFHEGGRLDGLAMFDVSGHGIASSLITMLAKHIVHRAFEDCTANSRSVSTALYRVNEQIIEAKGDIENYMTGILMRFGGFDGDDVCRVELANAGHPRPLLYRADSGEVSEIVHDDGQFQYGAIGLANIDVSFPEIVFSMAVGDVFVCYTDGLTESMNSRREEFGRERVMDVLRQFAHRDALAIMDALTYSLDEFTDGVKREDDLTIIILKRSSSMDFLEELDSE